MGQLAFFEDVTPGDARARDVALELVFVTFVHLEDGGARFVWPVRKDEARRLSRLEPDLELHPCRLFVRDHGLGEERFDRLRVVDVALCDITGDNADAERLGEIDPEDLRIIVRVPMHRLGVDLDLVETRDRYALEEVFNMSVAALSGVCVRLLVKAEEFVVEGLFMRAAEFFVLLEVLREMPGFRLHRRFAEPTLDEAVCGLEILVEEESRSDEGVADIVEMMARFVLREIGRQTEGVDAATEEGLDGVLILAVREAPHHGA